MLASIIIRTYNEQKYLPELLAAIRAQDTPGFDYEIVIVDSGSTDKTVAIARSFDCRITTIEKSSFSFGRALNIGCEFATGEVFVMVSGHCIPTDKNWLTKLISPFQDNLAGYVYGRQLGARTTKFSEQQLFDKYFPAMSMVPQDGFFCNNANAAIHHDVWARHRFDEDLTGLEDLDTAKKLVASGGRVAYVADASVFHIHNESWSQVRNRYEREAIAMQRIESSLHIGFFDALVFFASAVFFDMIAAFQARSFFRNAAGILAFRMCQYIGTYTGCHEHRKLSQARKHRYYYPRRTLTNRESRPEGKLESAPI